MAKHLWVVAAVLLAMTVAACEEEPSSGQSQTETSDTEAPADVQPAAGPSTGQESMGETSMDEEPATEATPGGEEDSSGSQYR